MEHDNLDLSLGDLDIMLFEDTDSEEVERQAHERRRSVQLVTQWADSERERRIKEVFEVSCTIHI
jgi:hypothetical protein